MACRYARKIQRQRRPSDDDDAERHMLITPHVGSANAQERPGRTDGGCDDGVRCTLNLTQGVAYSVTAAVHKSLSTVVVLKLNNQRKRRRKRGETSSKSHRRH